MKKPELALDCSILIAAVIASRDVSIGRVNLQFACPKANQTTFKQ